MDGNDSGGSGNYGGIVGYTQNDASTICNISNCLFDGKLKNSAATPGNCTFGGMVGYIGAGPKVTATNCLSIGTVQSKITGQFYGAVKNTTCSILNSYYQGANVNGSASTVTLPTQQATLVTDAQLASGETAVKLGEAFGQMLGSDAYPILDPAAPKVYEIAVTDVGYATFVPKTNILAIPNSVTAYAGQKNGTSVHLEEVAELPADNAVVIKANEGSYYCNSTDETRTLGVANDLTFSETDITADGTQYILAKPDGEEVGFYQATTGTIEARKAYIVSTSGVKAFFIDDDPTSINDLKDLKDSNGLIFNLSGQRLSKLQKGVNVIDNKKVLK